ncbi:hypothetical protein N7462_005578 [Penicillium macrosclerotiorum]|uniref:uncharacterized protein n=1 Tax=Penicillium macrosclerotiorum TaxID=303699 RepID=UPI00254727B7|nr:uncharacterized protein N7462_005578 [Penicillium macrosclerotiorum]KAJ5682413.1 hypothetical protein N7462_005578 [Penicillium macrosclerotiorum]
MDLRRYNVERSCLRCHERKVRCDKGSPCNKCLRLNVSCQYPGPRRAKRRPPKTTVTDVVARLEQLERSIMTLAGNKTTDQPVQTAHSAQVNPTSALNTTRNAPVMPTLASITGAPSNQRSIDDPLSHHGFLVKDGAYIDEPLLSRVLEKEKDLQTTMRLPNTESNVSRKPPPLKVDGIITNPLLVQTNFKAFHPSRWQATLLWQTFLSRVDPVLKIIHIPTTTPRIFTAINRPDAVQADVHCLLFAVFFAATTALVSDKPENEETRSDLKRYQQGLELAMYGSSFLDSPTVTSLQAMAIYLTCLRYTNSGRSGFTLRGLTIRAAQSIGVHRDGRHFKLSPLECELRRRLWWTLYTTDARMAEDHGITVSEQEFGGDTDLPANIDDLNLSENATETPQSQPRWTDMTFTIIIAEINRMWFPITRSLAACPDGTQCEALITELKDRLTENYLQYADMDIPIQRQGVMVAQVLVSKLEVHMRQKMLQLAGASVADASTPLLSKACCALELGLDMYTDDLLRGTRWLTSTYTQYHMLTYLLWHLCVSPTGPDVDRAWRAVNTHFDLIENDPSWPDPGPKWPIVAYLRAKALRIRQAQVAPEQNEQDLADVAVGTGSGLQESAAGGLGGSDALLEMEDWDLNWLEFPDWNFLAQSIAIVGHDGGQGM